MDARWDGKRAYFVAVRRDLQWVAEMAVRTALSLVDWKVGP